jgi:hypothetical protein
LHASFEHLYEDNGLPVGQGRSGRNDLGRTHGNERELRAASLIDCWFNIGRHFAYQALVEVYATSEHVASDLPGVGVVYFGKDYAIIPFGATICICR